MNVDPYPGFHLPNKNIFLTTDFSLIPPSQPYLDVAKALEIDLEKTSMKDVRKIVDAAPKINKTLTHGQLVAAVENFRFVLISIVRVLREVGLAIPGKKS